MNGMTGREGRPDRGRPGAVTAVLQVTVRRGGQGWVGGLVGGVVMVIARLAALVVVLAVLAGVTAVLWWAGLAEIPVVVLVYVLIAVAGGGFAAGRFGRLVSRRPEGPAPRPWERRGAGHARNGSRAQEDPVIAGPFGSAQPEERQ